MESESRHAIQPFSMLTSETETAWTQMNLLERMKSSGQMHQRAFEVVIRGGSSRRRAFSLIELLFVMLIIMILFTAMWGFGSKDSQAKRKARCQAVLQKLYISMQIYATDCSGSFPVVTNAATSEAAFDLLVPRYNSDTAMFICPGSKDVTPPAGESLLKHKISYAYYMGRRATSPSSVLMSDKQINSLSKSNYQQVFSTDGKSPGNNHHKYGGNFLFTDGHTEETSALLKFDLIIPPGVVLLNPKP